MRDLLGGLLAATGLTRPRFAVRGRLAVITFHRVLPPGHRGAYPLPGLVVTPEELAWFLDFAADHFTCGHLAETVARSAEGHPDRPLLAVTFDDGQRDNFEYARPVLKRAGVSATFFVPTAAVDDGKALWHDRMGFAAMAAWRADAPAVRAAVSAALPETDARGAGRALVTHAKSLTPDGRAALLERLEAIAGDDPRPDWDGIMTWEQIGCLAEEGFEIGSHSVSHALLTQCTDAELEHELVESKRVLEGRLQRPVSSFCYPDGDHDPRVVAAVRDAGYAQAVTTTWGTNAADADRLRLKRCDMNAEHARRRDGRLSPARLAWRLSGLYPGLGR